MCLGCQAGVVSGRVPWRDHRKGSSSCCCLRAPGRGTAPRSLPRHLPHPTLPLLPFLTPPPGFPPRPLSARKLWPPLPPPPTRTPAEPPRHRGRKRGLPRRRRRREQESPGLPRAEQASPRLHPPRSPAGLPPRLPPPSEPAVAPCRPTEQEGVSSNSRRRRRRRRHRVRIWAASTPKTARPRRD